MCYFTDESIRRGYLRFGGGDAGEDGRPVPQDNRRITGSVYVVIVAGCNGKKRDCVFFCEFWERRKLGWSWKNVTGVGAGEKVYETLSEIDSMDKSNGICKSSWHIMGEKRRNSADNFL